MEAIHHAYNEPLSGMNRKTLYSIKKSYKGKNFLHFQMVLLWIVFSKIVDYIYIE